MKQKGKFNTETFVKLAFGSLFLALSVQTVFFNHIFSYNVGLQVALLVMFGVVSVGVLYGLKRQNVLPLLVRHRYRVLVLCVVFLFAMQSLCSYQTVQELNHDIGRVFNGAILYVNNPEHPDYYQYENYINHWSNNAGLFVLFIALVKVLNFFGSDAYYLAAVVLGQLFFSGALVFTFLYLEKAYHALAAVFSLFCWLCFPVVYLQAAVIYTDTYSLMFVPLSLLLLWLARREPVLLKRILYAALAGLSLFCGIQIKATVLFVALAVFLEAVLQKERLSRLCTIGAVVLTVVLVLNAFATAIKHEIVLDEEKLESMGTPTVFWVMMGLSSVSGEFNIHDEDAIRHLPTQAEKQAYCLDVIQTRLSERGVPGSLEFFLTKLNRTFGSGESNIGYMLSRGPLYPQRTIYSYVLPEGSNYALFINPNQAVYVFLNLLMVLGAFLSLKDKERSLMAVYIALCGFVVFMLLWESNHRQLINQWSLYMMAASVGLWQVERHLKIVQKKKKIQRKNSETNKS